jgi:oxygen-dependent protoporphyrinogen oxidase
MRVSVIGAGPAGLTAAWRLQQAGHRVEVLEAGPVVGGRTHSEHFGPGHHCDTGAGWLATFYTRTLALLDELGCRDMLRERAVRGAGDVAIGGRLYPLPFSPQAIAASPLVPDAEKAAVAAYYDDLRRTQPADLQVDLAFDNRDAETELAPLGSAVLEYAMRPTFEGPFYSRLNALSAAMVRAWQRVLLDGSFYQVAAGMDAPWLRLAELLHVRVDEPVEAVRLLGGRVEVVTSRTSGLYDGAVLAVPAPEAARIAGQGTAGLPPWLGEVRYAPQVRVYAARPSSEDVQYGVYLVPATTITTVEFSSGRHGAWGACPDGWQWALVCAHGAASGALLELPAADVTRTLWAAGRQVAPHLFDLDAAEVVHLMRWTWAVPVMGPGHYTRLAAYRRTPPLVLAGDWTHQACVEGAVRSGEAAAAAFGPSIQP